MRRVEIIFILQDIFANPIFVNLSFWINDKYKTVQEKAARLYVCITNILAYNEIFLSKIHY